MPNAHLTSNAPTTISHFLRGISFPTEKEALVSTAEHNGADESILEKLDNLPEGDFTSMADVMKAYGSEIDQQGGEEGEDTYQATPAQSYGEKLEDRPVDLSNRQDRVWSGNPGSQEKLERNNTGNTPQTIRSSEAPKAPAQMEDDTNVGRFEDLSGAKTQGQGYEMAGGKTPARDTTRSSQLSDELSDEVQDEMSRRPF